MYQKLVELLRIHGYRKADTQIGPCYVKYIGEQEKCVWITFDRNPDGSSVTEEEFLQMQQVLKNQMGRNIPVLILVLSEEGRNLFLDEENLFEELYEPVAMILSQQQDLREDVPMSEKERNLKLISRLYTYKMTALILLLNAAGFFLTEIYGDVIYDIGACDVYRVKVLHEFYRLLTSNYLHFGWDHFFNNMIALLLLGSTLERIMGSFRYLVLYTGAGIIGSILSAGYYIKAGEYVVSAGASGAIFGIMGALAALFLFCRKQRQNLNGSGFFILIAGSLYHGMQSGTTDNAAHIGGCIAGFILAVLLYVLWQERQG